MDKRMYTDVVYASEDVFVMFACVYVRSEFNMAAHRFETPTSTIDKSESTNDRQRKHENIGVLTVLCVCAMFVYEAKQQAIHKCRSQCLNGNDIVFLT